ncbi:hypothetical protein HY844_00310 [Candidatus Berkelbacteria bacterium]|nr:hypothetical protein [Candidatus Berkelbacteria bacterium]
MGFWASLFGVGNQASFRKIDWLEVEGKIRSLEALSMQKDQANAKQLIIQADILVDSITKQAGVKGATFGERLKSLRGKIDRSVYSNLWQAHIKRNELVHDHGSFVAEWEKSKYYQAFKDAISAMRGLR